jgi:hypothetical protein
MQLPPPTCILFFSSVVVCTLFFGVLNHRQKVLVKAAGLCGTRQVHPEMAVFKQHEITLPKARRGCHLVTKDVSIPKQV